MKFENKTIVITGGSHGIGAATAKHFEKEGAAVIVLDIKPLSYESPTIQWIKCDVAEQDSVRKAIAVMRKKHPRINYLFCNAGVHLFANIENTSLAELQTIVGTNLLGTIFCLQQILPAMKSQGEGSVVLMSSDQAFIAKEECAIYGATKAAIAQLAKSTALDYAKYNIRVNCVCPGTINTDMYHRVIEKFQMKTGQSSDEIHQNISAKLALKRIGNPEEVASVVSFLCSPEASFMTGALVSIDGGYTIS